MSTFQTPAPDTRPHPAHRAHREAETAIDLGRDQRFVAGALWHVLAPERTPWLDEIGRRVEALPGSDDGFEAAGAMLDLWAKALQAELGTSARAELARRTLARVHAHAEAMRRNRYIYSHTTAEEIAHRYWPSGARPPLDRENLYSMPLSPRAHDFVTPTTRIMSAGSCFAFEIGKALRKWGYDYFVTEPGPDDLSDEERWARHYGHFNARYGRLFNTPGLRQLVERGLGQLDLDPLLFEQDGRWRDPYRDGILFDSPEEWRATLPAFRQGLERALLEADVMILTLGVNEVWRFTHDGSYLSRVPWKLSPALLERQVLTVDDNVRELQRLHDLLVAANPDVRLIVSVSPIPLLATFRAEDHNVVAANAHSKSTLRVAAEAFSEGNERVVYFPAYEAVLYGTRTPFIGDGRHVSDDAVARVMGEFRRMFCATPGTE